MFGINYIVTAGFDNITESFAEFENEEEFKEQISALKILSNMDQDELEAAVEENSAEWNTVCGWLRWDEYAETITSISYEAYKIEKLDI